MYEVAQAFTTIKYLRTYVVIYKYMGDPKTRISLYIKFQSLR